MNDKIIEFSAPKKYLDFNKNFPKPIKLNIPEWYKKLKHTVKLKTIKGCIPFLETLTTGYSLELPQDFYLKTNHRDGGEELHFEPSLEVNLGVNLNSKDVSDAHNPLQLKDSPALKKNLNFPVLKIMNPWTIRTPKGYSCLFVPPLNNGDDRFEIIPAIVNTDDFSKEVNFPFILNGDKYPVQDTTLKQGTPYVQVIPFKRNSWKLKIIDRNKNPNLNKDQNPNFNLASKILNIYKEIFWDKISWK